MKRTQPFKANQTMRLLRILPLVIVLGLTAAPLAGCSKTKAPYRVSADPYGRQQVYVADRRLSSLLRFEEPRVSYDEADLMHVALDVRAATNRPQIVQYRTTFFDRTGQELHASTWRTVTLESNVPQTLSATSTTPRATDFQIDIRTAR
jgi:uncharacterized protein YcfL